MNEQCMYLIVVVTGIESNKANGKWRIKQQTRRGAVSR